MKTRILINENDLDVFKEACDRLDGVDFVSHDGKYATISYKWDFSLFYLGQSVVHTQKLKELA